MSEKYIIRIRTTHGGTMFITGPKAGFLDMSGNKHQAYEFQEEDDPYEIARGIIERLPAVVDRAFVIPTTDPWSGVSTPLAVEEAIKEIEDLTGCEVFGGKNSRGITIFIDGYLDADQLQKVAAIWKRVKV